MLAQGEQERLTGEILRTSYEAATLEDLGSEVLPLFDKLLDTSTSLLYQANERRELIAIDGPLVEGHYVYAASYYAVDPLQTWLKSYNPTLLHSAAMPDYKHYLDHPAHRECSTHYGFDNCLHLRLNDRGMHHPGMVGMALARTSQQADFSEREKMIVVQVLPALEALVRRSSRLSESVQTRSFLESMLESEVSPKLALDPRGGLLWASRQADAWLDISRRKIVPEALVEATRRLGTLIGRKTDAALPISSLTLRGKKGQSLRAELSLARNRDGAYFVVAELEEAGKAPIAPDIQARYGLTSAEAQVLGLLALGLSDKEISGRLHVSMATVHSHVNRILGKMGLRSRVQAALIARGHALEADEGEASQPSPQARR